MSMKTVVVFRKNYLDTMFSNYMFDRRFEVKFPSRNEWENNEVLSNIFSDIRWYTDCSKARGKSPTDKTKCGSLLEPI